MSSRSIDPSLRKSKRNAEVDAPLRVGMVGVGNFGAFRRKGMRMTGLFQIACCHDWNAVAAEACRVEDGAQVARSFDELLNHPKIEAVVISTGAKYHTSQILAALDRGLHVFVEKPLCSSSEELEQLLAASRSTDRVIVVGHNDHAQDAVSCAIRSVLQSGELGRIATFQKTTAHSGGLKIKPGDWRGDAGANPGGMLFQCGVHGLHELMFYFGDILEVESMMSYDVHETLTADVALCHLRFASGLVGTLDAFHVTPYRHALTLYGTEGALYREDRYFAEGTSLWLQKRNPTGGYEPRETVPAEGATDVWAPLRNFYRAVRCGDAPVLTLEHGARAVAVVLAAEKSAELGRRVLISEVAPSLFRETPERSQAVPTLA